MSQIHVITASAGSGKTTRLVKVLEDSLAAGEVRPEAVVATTFTKHAAAELAERARSTLLARGHVDAAHRLLAARIGTVNSVCGRLVEDFTFELGLPPGLRVLDQGPADEVLRDALAGVMDSTVSDELQELGACMPKLEWMDQVKRVIEGARANRIAPEQLAASAQRSIASLTERLPPPALDERRLDADLLDAMAACEKSIDLDVDTTGVTSTYLNNVRRLRVRHASGALTWPEWAKLSTDSPGKKSAACATAVLAAAGEHVRHPRLRRQMARAIELVFEIARAGLVAFQTLKREQGVMDFVDQEVYALEALSLPSVRAALEGEIDLLLVDEFQDTSPLQLAIFLRLAELAKRSVWVGDQKQAIFGFRGTDPRLMDSAIEDAYDVQAGAELVDAAVSAIAAKRKPETLEKSWRSRPALVDLTSDVFAPAFDRHGIPPERTRLVAGVTTEPKGLGVVVEHWELELENKAKTSELPLAVAAGVEQLIAEQPTVRDRATGAARASTPGDIAVLCRTNAQSQGVADALKSLGIEAVVPRLGLLDTIEGRVAMAALRLWIDPRDSLASAELERIITHPDNPETWLAEVLESEDDAPLVVSLRARRDASPALGVLAAFDAAIAAIDLPHLCRGWGSDGDRRANLDALRAHAVSYASTCESDQSPATLAGLYAYLAELAVESEYDGTKRTDSQAVRGGPGVVTVSTWHAAKGLEWPITILFGLETMREPLATGVHVSSDRATFDATDPLGGRWLRYWPDPYWGSKGGVRGHLEAGPEFAELGTKATRESLRLLYVGWTRARDRLILAAATGKLQTGILATLGFPLAVPAKSGAVTWSGRKVVVTHRVLSPTGPKAPRREGGLAYPTRAPGVFAPARANPSTQERVGTAGTPEVIGARVALLGNPDMTSLGQAVHGFLGADRPGLAAAERREIALGLLRRWRVDGALEPVAMLTMSDNLSAWIARRWAEPRRLPEWPVRHRLPTGTVLVGTADLVVDHAAGLAVVDHKTFPGSDDEAIRRAASYAGQLDAYAQALTAATGRAAIALFIHLPVLGLVVPVN